MWAGTASSRSFCSGFGFEDLRPFFVKMFGDVDDSRLDIFWNQKVIISFSSPKIMLPHHLCNSPFVTFASVFFTAV